VQYTSSIKYGVEILKSLFVFENQRPRIYSRVKVIVSVYSSEIVNAYKILVSNISNK